MRVMELDDILNFDRLVCMGGKSKAGWYLDQDAILEAIDQLGIKLKVRVKFQTFKRRGRGTHYIEFDRTHLITVDQLSSIESANFILWHELAHCMQAERWANEDSRRDIFNWHSDDYKAVDGEWGNSYRGNAYEIEANRIGHENADFHLVVSGT